jgi:hypothetical protein
VHHAARPMLFEQFHRVAVRVAVVDNNRQVHFVRKQNLLFKNIPLHFVRRIFFKVVIKANFADSHHLRLSEQRFELFLPVCGMVVCFFGVDSRSGVKIWVFFREGCRFAGRRKVSPAVEHAGDAEIGKFDEKLFTVLVKGLVVVMCVAVEDIAIFHVFPPYAKRGPL